MRPSLTELSVLARGEVVLVILTPPVELDVGDGVHHRDDLLPVLHSRGEDPLHQDGPLLLVEVLQAGVIEHLDTHLLPETPPAPPAPTGLRLEPHRVGNVRHQRELVDTPPRSEWTIITESVLSPQVNCKL